MKIRRLDFERAKRDKKGGVGILIFFAALMGVLVLGFIATIGYTVIDYASDTITPIMTSLGVIDTSTNSTNLSEYAEYGFGTLDTAVQSFYWIIIIGYIMALLFTLIFIYVSGYTPHPAYMAFYFALMMLLIFLSILLSNAYQDIYSDSGEIATRLQAQTTMSYMILHSPLILTVVAIIGGILMFARHSSNDVGAGVGI